MKSRNFSKYFIELFVNFSSIFGNLSEIFWIIVVDEKMYCNFQIFCVWNRRYDISVVKNDQNLTLYVPRSP